MSAPVIEWIRPGVGFVAPAGASFRRAESDLGRRIDVNSTYRDYNKQLSMWRAWNAYAAGTGPYPGHSRALHPDASMHCKGLALDSDDWRTPGFISFMAERGWIRTAANDPTERHHFEYQSWRDIHRNRPASGAGIDVPKTHNPAPAEPEEEEEEDDMRPIVHILIDSKGVGIEAALVHPDFGRDLEPYTGVGTGGRREEGVTTVRRGYITTRDQGRMNAWLRTYSKGIGSGTSRTPLEGTGNYRDILIAASAVSSALAAT